MATVVDRSIEERVARLERRNRNLERWLIVAAALLILGIAAAATGSAPGVIEAQRVVLRDSDGRLRASLGPLGLSFMDAEERGSAWFSVAGNTRQLALAGQDGLARLSAEVDEDGSAFLYLYYKGGKVAIGLDLPAGRPPDIRVQDDDGKTVFLAPSSRPPDTVSPASK